MPTPVKITLAYENMALRPIAVPAVLGHSIGREICRQKMREAERRLEKTDDKVAVIAQELGFCSAAYFVKRFRDEHGMTPHRFRVQAPSKGASFQRLPV